MKGNFPKTAFRDARAAKEKRKMVKVFLRCFTVMIVFCLLGYVDITCQGPKMVGKIIALYFRTMFDQLID